MTDQDDEPAHAPPGHGQQADDAAVDRALAVALDELIDAVHETKQAVWVSSAAEQHRALEALQSFLVDKVREVGTAEADIDGHSPFLVMPSARHPRNLAARAHGDPAAIVALLVADLQALAADVRQQAGRIAGREEAQLLERLADGLEDHLAGLRP